MRSPIDPYINALERALPGPNRYAVMNRLTSTPDRPIAVFGFEDDAYTWARQEYGHFEGFTFHMQPGIEILPVGAPAVLRP